MISRTDDDKMQLGQLTDYLFTHRGAIVDRWRTKCSRDEDLHALDDSAPQAEFTDQLLVLLHSLIQRITDGHPTSDRIDEPKLNHWPQGPSLAELTRGLDNFYDVLDEQIQQFLELFPNTQPRVITQAYSQLLWLSREVNRDSIIHVGQLRQPVADEQIQTLQVTLDNLRQLNQQRIDYLQQTAHDLRGSFGILSTAASILQGPLKDDDRAKFMDMISRNIKAAEHQIAQMLAYAQLEASSANSVSANEADLRNE